MAQNGQTSPGADASLGRHAARGVSWLLAQSVLSKIAGVVGNLVLGWLLMPEAFGLVGLAYSVSIFVSLVSQAGLREILTQRHKRSARWVTPGFWMSVSTGLLGMCVLISAAPLVAELYAEPGVIGLLWVLAATTLVNSVAVGADAQLHAQLRFGLLGVLGVATTVGKVLLTVALAGAGWGAYSIVVPGLVFAVVGAGVMWWQAPAKPRLELRLGLWKYLASSSFFVFGATGLYTLMTQSGSIFLGVFSTAAAVGVFYFAFQLALQPLMLLGNSVRRVLLPTLARMNADPARQTAALERSSRLLMLMVFPLAWFQIPLAGDFMGAVFPERWAPAAVVLQMLSIAIPLRTLGWTGGAALQAQGRFRTQFVLALAGAAGSFVIVGVCAWAGPVWLVALGFSVFVMALEPVTYAVAARRPVGEAMGAFARPVVAGGVGTVACLTGAELARLLDPNAWTVMGVGALSGLGAYALSVRLIVPDAWRDLVDQAARLAPVRLRACVPAADPIPVPEHSNLEAPAEALRRAS